MATKYPSLLATQGDKHQALFSGLLGLGGQLSQGYTDRPTSTLAGLAQGGQAFATSYQDKINQAKQGKLGDAKYQHMQAQMEAQKMAIEKAQEEKLFQERLVNWDKMGRKDMAGGAAAMPKNAAMLQEEFGQGVKAFAPKVPVAGRDVPYGPDVYQQQVGIAGARAEAGAPLQEVQTPQGPQLISRKQAVGMKPFVKPTAAAEKDYSEATTAIDSGREGIAGLKEALAYSNKTFSGAYAEERAAVAKNIPFISNISPETEQEAIDTGLMDNIVKGQALASLKATFGGMPTEGERKILMEIQGSSSLPKAEREAIWNRAIKLVEKRVAINEKKAAHYENRFGKAYSLGYGASSGPVRIKGDADYNKLKSGDVYIGPDNVERTKP